MSLEWEGRVSSGTVGRSCKGILGRWVDFKGRDRFSPCEAATSGWIGIGLGGLLSTSVFEGIQNLYEDSFVELAWMSPLRREKKLFMQTNSYWQSYGSSKLSKWEADKKGRQCGLAGHRWLGTWGCRKDLSLTACNPYQRYIYFPTDSVCLDAKHTIRKVKLLKHSPNRVQYAKA
jgi:hypothetical protein